MRRTAFLIITLVIFVNEGNGTTAQDGHFDEQVVVESNNRAVTVISSPQYVTQPTPKSQSTAKSNPQTHRPENRPPSKPPIIPIKIPIQNYHLSTPRHQGYIQKIPPPSLYSKHAQQYNPNSIYKYPRVIPLPTHYRKHYYKTRPLIHAASIGRPSIAKSPKFSLPVQVVNGVGTDVVKPPILLNTTITSTTTTAASTVTTTQKILRTKRIWPTHANSTTDNTTITSNSTTAKDNTTLEKGHSVRRYNTSKVNITDDKIHDTSESRQRFSYVYRNATGTSTTESTSTERRYRPVTRSSKVKITTTTLSPINFTKLDKNDWVPIFPSHYPYLKKPAPTPINKRSDKYSIHSKTSPEKLYLQSFGLIPVKSQIPTPVMSRKKMVFFKRKRQLNPNYSGYSPRSRRPTRYTFGDLESDGSHNNPRTVTKIKHHHHHHHHRYIKTVEKPIKVPYKVEVPKPYPVTVEKQVPVPVEKIKIVEKPMPYPVEKRIPYPISIKVPVPIKVVEKEYVPKPYPIVHHVPVVKHVEVKVPQPVPVEKKVPYPVKVKVPVPVDRPVPVPVHVEKRVPYPVPVKVLVPQPYPVETKVPYPVEVKVKEPYEVIKHVPVKVPYPQPYAVKVPHPVPVRVEKKVPYPVEVEKKVPIKVYVPQRVEVEKKVPVYVPRPYPVEKKLPYPVKVPYPVQVPVEVPVEVPVYIHHPYQVYNENYPYSVSNNIETATPGVETEYTSTPQHSVTVHGNSGFTGFQKRSDHETTTAATSVTIDS